MPSADFLDLLNVYFECAARPVIAAGGEVLAFVGDAVLAIFPVDGRRRELPGLTRRVLVGAPHKSLVMTDRINAERIARRQGADPLRHRAQHRAGHVRQYRRAGAARLFRHRPDGDRGGADREADEVGRRARARHPRGRRARAASLALDRPASRSRASGSRRSFSGSRSRKRRRRRRERRERSVPLRGAAGLRRLRAGERSRGLHAAARRLARRRRRRGQIHRGAAQRALQGRQHGRRVGGRAPCATRSARCPSPSCSAATAPSWQCRRRARKRRAGRWPPRPTSSRRT